MAKVWTAKEQRKYLLPCDFGRIESCALLSGKVAYQLCILSDVVFARMLTERNMRDHALYGFPTTCAVYYEIAADTRYIAFDPVPDRKYEIKLIYTPQPRYWE